ncbi:MAG TPA: hypothetical protein VH396_00040 [Chitinophagaceae bacterium]|jgi:hypothetical protein
MEVTGPKTDIWLVKTVSLLLLSVSLCFITGLLIKTDRRPLIILATACCISLASIDFYYAGKKIISPVYYVDGILQLIFLFVWIIILPRIKKQGLY